MHNSIPILNTYMKKELDNLFIKNISTRDRYMLEKFNIKINLELYIA